LDQYILLTGFTVSVVCNHPNLFETRPIISPLQTEGLNYLIPSLLYNMPDEQDAQVLMINFFNETLI